VGFKHPEVFGNVLSQSGSFWWKPDEEKNWEWLTHQFAASPRIPLRFSFEAGLLENTSGGPAGRPFPPPLLVANRNLRDTLQSKGYSVHYTEFNGNHTLFNWRGTLASHLIALVGIKPEPKISAGAHSSLRDPQFTETHRDSSSQSGSRSVAKVRWQI
jgi:enterochelin esterase family protein